MLPLHLTLTTWPVVVVQALFVAHLLRLARRTVLPESPAWLLLPAAAVLALVTPLPWLVSQLMPDVFTGVLVLALAYSAPIGYRAAKRSGSGYWRPSRSQHTCRACCWHSRCLPHCAASGRSRCACSSLR